MPPPVNLTPASTVYRRLRSRLDARLEALLAMALPSRCLLCCEPGASGIDLCSACHAGLPVLAAACPRCALPMPVAELPALEPDKDDKIAQKKKKGTDAIQTGSVAN